VLFKKVLEHQEYRLKRIRQLPALDEKNYKTLVAYICRLKTVNKWFKNKPWKELTTKEIKKVYDDLEDGKILSNRGWNESDYLDFFDSIPRQQQLEQPDNGWEDSIQIDFQVVEFTQSILGRRKLSQSVLKRKQRLERLAEHYKWKNLRAFFKFADSVKYKDIEYRLERSEWKDNWQRHLELMEQRRSEVLRAMRSHIQYYNALNRFFVDVDMLRFARPYYLTRSSWRNFMARLKGFKSFKNRYPYKKKCETKSILKRFGTYSNYLNQRAIRQGYKSYSEMRKFRYKQRTGQQYSDYRKSLLAKNGFKTNGEYRRYIAKKHGFNSFKAYEDEMYRKKGYLCRAEYRKIQKFKKALEVIA